MVILYVKLLKNSPAHHEKRIIAPLRGSPEKIDPAILAPVSALIKREEDQRREAEALVIATAGFRMPCHGIYLTSYRVVSPDRPLMSRKFNVIASPEDLVTTENYDDTVNLCMAPLKNWFGHDGENYATSAEIDAALLDGSYRGGWVIPPLELLTGDARDVNLYACRNRGAFNKSFTDAASSPPLEHFRRDWYWSSTTSPEKPGDMMIARFSEGGRATPQPKTGTRMHCRPVRFVRTKS